MNILAIESSDQTASVAIVQENTLLYEETLGSQRTHSETLLLMIDRALKTVSLTYQDIDAFAVNQGPGSFTGLRIGICTANALGMAWNKPVISVSAFESLAGNVSEYPYLICPLIDARNTQVYTIAYWNTLQQCDFFAGDIQEWLVQLEQIKQSVDAKSICFVGRGALTQKQFIVDYFREDAVFASMQNMTYRASVLAMIAIEKIKHGDYAKEAMPLYVRKSQAEREHYGE